MAGAFQQADRRRRCTQISRKSGCRNGRRRIRHWRKRLQAELKVPVNGLATKIPPHAGLRGPRPGGDERRTRRAADGGGSDDIGDVSWEVPTVRLSYPSNIPGGPGHNWANAMSMATPIAHKGVVAGAKVQAMTMLDILLHPELVDKAWDYFRTCKPRMGSTRASSARTISRRSG